MRLSDKDVLLPTMIMAYSNPRWYDFVAASYNVPFGDFIEDRIETEVFKDALWAVVGEQERAGLDLVADSRTFTTGNYSDVVVYYFSRLTGFVPYGPNVKYPLYSTLRSPTCVGDITRAVPMMAPIARMLTELTDAPLKIQWTAAGTLTGLSADRYYSSERDRAMAIAAALNEDILEVDAIDQVKVLQLDEWFWPYQYEDWSIEVFNRMVEGVRNAKVMIHLCVGNYRGGRGYRPDDTAKPGEGAFDLHARKGESLVYESVIPKVYEAKIDILNMQVIEEADLGVLEALRKHPLPDGVDFVCGVIDPKSTYVETPEEVADRISRVLEVVPAERLGLTTGCGLKNLPRLTAYQKIRSLADGAKLARERLSVSAAA
ncbi:2-hydroxypropyl-CoM lyase [Carbonactinospora thermoautotrophica]|uniref:2-hydroxypropyl-CoM lyase n=1 Tax=Carbonactinospora thermoautotrophica TaxID=1469144 RepID=UPI003DA88984|nr:2-hydroxypropyl-CoM lyase [Carbonactinospora thermoautotrophica]